MLKRLNSLSVWLGLLLVSLVIHLLLSWHASRSIVQPLTVQQGMPEAVEVMLDLAETSEKEELVFEDQIEFEPPSVLVPTTALAPPPPNVNLAMEAAAGGHSSGGFSAPLLANEPERYQ